MTSSANGVPEVARPVGVDCGSPEPTRAPAIGLEARRAETRLAEARCGARQPGPQETPQGEMKSLVVEFGA